MKFLPLLLVLSLSSCFMVDKSTFEPSSVNLKTFTGKYIYGHEVSSFQACQSTEGFWLSGNEKEMTLIENASLNLASERNEPYQEIYIEFIGEPDFSNPEGFAKDFDGMLTLRKLLTYSNNIPEGC